MTQGTAVAGRPPFLEMARAYAGHFVELWLGGMFLKPQTYAYMRDRKNAAANGATYIAVIGVLTALAGIVGAGVRYAGSPSVAAIKNTVLTHIQAMPFYTQTPGLDVAFNEGFQRVWDQFGSLFVGYPADGAGLVQLLITLLTNPLWLLLTWLLYGALVHLVGRGWNRETSYGELLGPLALAASPQLLRAFELLPGGSASGVVIVLWSLVLNIFAVKAAYQTTTRRAVWGALFPILLALVLLILLLGVGVTLLLAAVRGGQ